MKQHERPDISTPSTGSDTPADKVVHPEQSLPPVQMAELSSIIQNAAKRAGWDDLMPVQSMTIPYILKERDLMVQSRTGSGKTGAFILPILHRIDASKNECQALILVPTRELANQVSTEAGRLAKGSNVRHIVVYGGVGYGPQTDALRGGTQLVIGTPGRLLDHLLKRNFSLDRLKMLVFDEADRLLSMGFYPDMRELQKHLPRSRFNGYMFSATFPTMVLRLARQFLRQPDFLSLSQDHVHVAETNHVYYKVPGMEKDRCLVRIIEAENPASAIIFCNTKDQVRYVATVLKRFGYDVDDLTADLSQKAREKVLQRVRNGTLRFLVATDLAGRGIDIPELSHVIQYEPPDDPEAYVHRAGRTGRAGAAGEAISLVNNAQDAELRRIALRFSIDMIEREVPSDEKVQEIVSERITAMLESELRSRDSLRIERMARFVPLAQNLGETEDETALIAMLLDDYYQKTLHAPTLQEPPEPASTPHTDPTRKPPRQTSRRPQRKRTR
ncbi:MAG: DEAD/DEAH box helicase [Candidatus Zixiibacteriota bacterium]